MFANIPEVTISAFVGPFEATLNLLFSHTNIVIFDSFTPVFHSSVTPESEHEPEPELCGLRIASKLTPLGIG